MSFVPKTSADERALIKALNLTFPGINAAPIMAAERRIFECGARVNGTALMPDEFPIFSRLFNSEPEYDDCLHTAFANWVEARGWYVEVEDGAALFVVPIREVSASLDRLNRAWYPPVPRYFLTGEVPF